MSKGVYMNFYDLDISQYDICALEQIFKLKSGYTIDDILKMETQLRNKIADSNIESKSKLIAFIEQTKIKLIDELHTINPVTNTFVTDVVRGTMNQLRKRTVTVSMSFHTLFRNPNSPSISHCNFAIPYPLRNVVSARVSSIELPKSIYLFNELNKTNCFYIQESITNYAKLIKIPEGFYDSTTLASLLQTTINLTLSGGDPTYDHFLVTIDTQNNRTIIVNKVNRFDMLFVTPDTNDIVYKNIGWKLGFRAIQYKGEYNYISEGLFDNTIPYIYLVVNDFSISNSSNVVAMFQENYIDKHILAKIIPYDECSKNNIFIKRDYFGPIDITKLEVKLLNEYGDLVKLNMMDYSFTLDFELVYDI